MNTNSTSRFHGNELKVYPNPAKESLYIRGENLKKISIYNLYGKIVHSSKPGGNYHKIDLSELRKGVYLLKVLTSFGEYSERIVVL
ncbi:MAG: T9SS type A sorting domain-containing protein [Bacteroidales bacterium]